MEPLQNTQIFSVYKLVPFNKSFETTLFLSLHPFASISRNFAPNIGYAYHLWVPATPIGGWRGAEKKYKWMNKICHKYMSFSRSFIISLCKFVLMLLMSCRPQRIVDDIWMPEMFSSLVEKSRKKQTLSAISLDSNLSLWQQSTISFFGHTI